MIGFVLVFLMIQKWRLIRDIGIVCAFASNYWSPSNLLDLCEGSSEGYHYDSLEGSHGDSLEGCHYGSLGCSLGGLDDGPFGKSNHFPQLSLPDPPGNKKN